MKTGLARVVTCCLLVMAGAASAGAQQFTGGVRGAVRDANGVIPGVAVTLTNEATNIARDTVTNDVGQYNFPAVTPGTYTLKTTLTGYKTHESKGLVVATQQFITLDVVLEVGALEESITVTGQSPLIDTSTASTGGVLDREALESLPAPGRNAFLIGVTVPTVMATGDPQFNRQQDQSNASIVSLGGGGSASAAKKKAPKRSGGGKSGGAASGDSLTAPMQGTIVKIAVEEGATVAVGDLVVVLEAMKMEQPITAHKAGTVTGLAAEVGATVSNGAVLCEITGGAADEA